MLNGREERKKTPTRLIHYFIGIVLPFLVIFCSNVFLWKEVRSSSTYLRDSRYDKIHLLLILPLSGRSFYSEHMRNQLSARDQRMAKSICKLCMAYLICNVPIIIYKGVYGNSIFGNSYVILFVSALFWMQSSVNFFIYAGSNKQYREAYFLFLKDAVFHVDGEETLSSGNRATTPRQLQHRTRSATRQSTKAASSKRRSQGETCRKVTFQCASAISTHKSEPFPITSQETRAFERGLTY